MLSVLTRARSGNPDRQFARQPDVTAAGTSGYRHVQHRRPACRAEIASTPPSAREPHSGAGWRRRWPSWFDATNDVYTDPSNSGPRPNTNRTHIREHREAIQRSAATWLTKSENASRLAGSDLFRMAPRLHIEAWYRAGLAGGE